MDLQRLNLINSSDNIESNRDRYIKLCLNFIYYFVILILISIFEIIFYLYIKYLPESNDLFWILTVCSPFVLVLFLCIYDNYKLKMDKRRISKLLDIIVNSKVMNIEDGNRHIYCSICLLNINIDENYSNLRCFHKFHTKCIKSWFAIKTNCPLCKERV